MMTLMAGDLIFVRGDSLTARAIEEITDSPYSHVAGVIEGTTLVEAQGFRKTGTIDASEYVGCADVYRMVFPLPLKKRNLVVQYAKAGIGGRYDYVLILLELLRCLWHVTISRYHERPNTRICSTFWANQVYRRAGIDLCNGIKYPTPADLAKSPLLKKVGEL